MLICIALLACIPKDDTQKTDAGIPTVPDGRGLAGPAHRNGASK